MKNTAEERIETAPKDISIAYFAGLTHKRITREEIDEAAVKMLQDFQVYIYDTCYDLPHANSVEIVTNLAPHVYDVVNRMCTYKGVTYKNNMRRTLRQFINRFDTIPHIETDIIHKVIDKLITEMSTIEAMCTKFINER